MNSDHVYLPTEPDPEGRGLRGRRKGRVRFGRSEELGAPSPFHLTGPHRRLSAEVVCVAGESARMLQIKSSEVPPRPPHCQPCALPVLSWLTLKPCTKGSLRASCVPPWDALLPLPCEGLGLAMRCGAGAPSGAGGCKEPVRSKPCSEPGHPKPEGTGCTTTSVRAK